MLSGAVPPLSILNLTTKRGAVLCPLELIVMQNCDKTINAKTASALLLQSAAPFDKACLLVKKMEDDALALNADLDIAHGVLIAIYESGINLQEHELALKKALGLVA